MLDKEIVLEQIERFKATKNKLDHRRNPFHYNFEDDGTYDK